MPSWIAAILGVVEGLTEYLPVSSTAHIDLAGRLLHVNHMKGFASFDIFIQIGAIFAVVIEYRQLLWQRTQGLFIRDAKAVKLFGALLIGFIPAAVLGLAFEKAIKAHLFGFRPICVAFVIGGVVMIGVEYWRAHAGDKGDDGLEHVGFGRGLAIGVGQCFALIPGTSRSMSTIVAGQLSGLSTATSAEFSFLLGLVTLSAACLYTGFKDRHALMHAGPEAVLIGVGVSFVVAWGVIHAFIRYLKTRGLAPFGYYRIALAALVWWTLIRV